MRLPEGMISVRIVGRKPVPQTTHSPAECPPTIGLLWRARPPSPHIPRQFWVQMINFFSWGEAGCQSYKPLAGQVIKLDLSAFPSGHVWHQYPTPRATMPPTPPDLEKRVQHPPFAFFLPIFRDSYSRPSCLAKTFNTTRPQPTSGTYGVCFPAEPLDNTLSGNSVAALSRGRGKYMPEAGHLYWVCERWL